MPGFRRTLKLCTRIEQPGLKAMFSALSKYGPVRSAVLLLGLIVGLAGHLYPVQAAARPATTVQAEVRPFTVPSGRLDVLTGSFGSWLGNRTRMIQFALVAVALGIFILHRK
jgi:hypothetical protein